MSDINLKTVRSVRLYDVSILLYISKENSSNKIKKEIRHALDSENHGTFENNISYVHDDYEYYVNNREDNLEVIITYMNMTIQISKYVPKDRIKKASRTVLEMSDNVYGVGGFNIKEYYLLEVSE